MSSTYTGNPANNPASITIPSDGDGPGIKVADVDPAFEGLADQIAWTQAHIPKPYSYADETTATIWSTDSATYVTAESGGVLVDVPDCVIGDVLIIAFGSMWRQANGTANHRLEAQLLAIDDQAGTPAPSAVPGTHALWDNGLPTDLLDHRQRLALTGAYTVAKAGTTRITFQARVQTAMSDDFYLTGGLTLTVLRIPI